MSKKKILYGSGIFCVLAVIIGIIVFFTATKDTATKELPYIQDVENWRDYSKDELEDICRQSSFKELGKFVYSMTDEEVNELTTYCPFLIDKEVNTVYYRQNEKTNQWASYDCSMMDYVQSIKADVLQEEKEKAIEEAKAKEEEKTEASGSDLTALAVATPDPDIVKKIKKLTYDSDVAKSKNFQLNSTTTLDLSTLDGWLKAADHYNDVALTDTETSFYIGLYTIGNQYRINDGIPEKSFSKYKDLKALDEKFHKYIFTRDDFSTFKKGNSDESGGVEYSNLFDGNSYNRIRVTVKVSDTHLRYDKDNSANTVKLVGNIVLTWPKAEDDGTDVNLIKRLYDIELDTPKLVRAAKVKKADGMGTWSKDGQKYSFLATDHLHILLFNFSYNCPGNCTIYSTNRFDLGAIGRFTTKKYQTAYASDAKDENGNPREIDVTTSDLVPDTLRDEVNLPRTLYTEDETTGILYKDKNDVQIQVNLASNTSASNVNKKILAYFRYWHENGMKMAKVKQQCEDVYVSNTAERLTEWVEHVFYEKGAEQKWMAEGATKYLIFAPEYAGLSFIYKYQEYDENGNKIGTEEEFDGIQDGTKHEVIRKVMGKMATSYNVADDPESGIEKAYSAIENKPVIKSDGDFYATNGSVYPLGDNSENKPEQNDLRTWEYKKDGKKYTINRILLKNECTDDNRSNFFYEVEDPWSWKNRDGKIVLYAKEGSDDYNDCLMKKKNDFNLNHYNFMFACEDAYSISVGRAYDCNMLEDLYIVYDMVQEDTGTSSPTPTDSIDETPTPTDSIDVTSAPSQNISASVTRHTSHKLTEAEILAICPILPPQTEQTEPPFTYTQTSQSYQEDNRKVVETELLNKRLSPGTYTIHVDTTYTITYNWKHNHISSCACPGTHYDYTDEDGHTHYKSCGTYCRCGYAAEMTTQQQYHSHNLNKDTYVTITIVNCDPKIEIAKKTVNRTEADTINWGTITEGISEIKDHEDMSIHSGVGVTCGVCAGTEIDYTVWKNISNAMNATETTGKIKFEKKPIERSGIGKEKAEITIDIGKLRLNQQNPGGKYPVKIEVTDSDGATTKNGLIYHTNEIISQLDFYTTNVLKVTDVLNVM